MGCLESEILVASWNGTTWSVDAVPNENATDGLASVDCTSTTSCVAIGGFYDGSTGISKSLVESWNGTDWSAIYGPNPGPQSSGYTSVNCNSLADCIGVGDIFNPSAGVQEQTLAATWNGAALSVVPSPDPSTTFDELDGLSCVGSNDCVAVGYSKSPSVDQTLIESWDGTTWSVVPGPGTGVEITTTSLPDGTTGIAYAATLTATGGNPPYSWRVVSGSKLPRGLRLNKATGQIYGTPKRVGSYSFAIEVRDTKTATKPHLRTFATTTLSITVSQD